LAHLVVGYAEHSRVQHLRMGDQHVLGFLWVDVDPAGDDDVMAAVGQKPVAVPVEVTDVTDGDPPVTVAGRRRLRLVLEVFERITALVVDFTDFAGRQLLSLSSRTCGAPTSGRPTEP
jgi:hypothetical protein